MNWDALITANSVINWIACIIWLFVLIPQVIKVFQLKDTCNISITFYVIYVIASLMWIIYASCMIAKHDENSGQFYGLLVTDSFCFIFSIAILSLKFKNVYKAKKLKMSELDYYEKHIKGKKESVALIRLELKIKRILISLVPTNLKHWWRKYITKKHLEDKFYKLDKPEGLEFRD